MSLLGLKSDFSEDGNLEAHRAPINQFAKKFINRSFSDPVLYVGPFGQMIREAVWEGIEGIGRDFSNKSPYETKLDKRDNWDIQDSSNSLRRE